MLFSKHDITNEHCHSQQAYSFIQNQHQVRSSFSIFELHSHIALSVDISVLGYDSVHWYGHVVRGDDGHVLRRALHFEDKGQRNKWRLKRTQKKQVEEESVKVGLSREDALGLSKWTVSDYLNTNRLRRIWPPSFVVDTIKF